MLRAEDMAKQSVGMLVGLNQYLGYIQQVAGSLIRRSLSSVFSKLIRPASLDYPMYCAM